MNKSDFLEVLFCELVTNDIYEDFVEFATNNKLADKKNVAKLPAEEFATLVALYLEEVNLEGALKDKILGYCNKING